jgi:hypothetical protein
MSDHDIHAVRERLEGRVKNIGAHYGEAMLGRFVDDVRVSDLRALLADHARLQNEVSGALPGPVTIDREGSRDEATGGATAALASGFTDTETLAFQLECIRRSIQADMRFSLNGKDPDTASPDKHIIPRCWLPLAAARNWVRTLLAAEEATRAVPAIPLRIDGGEAVHSQQSDQAPAKHQKESENHD